MLFILQQLAVAFQLAWALYFGLGGFLSVICSKTALERMKEGGIKKIS
jgi:hypothetical protein